MKNTGPKRKAGRKPKQKNALAKANAERKAASLKKKNGKTSCFCLQWLMQSPIPGSERSPPCSPRPPINETEVPRVYSVINSTPASSSF
jgi:hypothetical protein